MKMARRRKGEMSVREAGHLGGLKGGKKGGEVTKARYGPSFYERIGQKGGRRGGETTKRRYGQEFYREIGRKGGRRVRELVDKGKRAEG